MKARTGLMVMVGVLALAVVANAVYHPHIGGSAGGTIYVKGPISGGPDNSPLHESWDLITPGSPNYLGYYYRFIFYDGTLHIDPTGKVGFTEKIFCGGNLSTQHGTINVEGHLEGMQIRPWKGGCSMELNLMPGGNLELDMLYVGIADGGTNSCAFNVSGGLATLEDMIVLSGDANSYVDMTGGEILINSGGVSEQGALDLIAANKIRNTSGEGLDVTTKGNYTSITLVPEPMSLSLLALSGLAVLRRRR